MARKPAITDAALIPLGPKDEIFVLEYLRDLHAGNAAVRAGFAKGSGAALMKKPAIKHAVEKAMADRAARVGLSVDRILDELGNLVFANPAELFDEDGRLKPLGSLPPDQAKLIVGMKTRRIVTGVDRTTGEKEEEEITEYKFIDKLSALQLAMRHMGMFKDTLTVQIGGLAERLAAASARTGAPALPAPDDAIEGEFEEVQDQQQVAQKSPILWDEVEKLI
ncbi:MAG: terminase small subunit [Bradyrhizobium sp.]|nr:terminase small subunit [Bradyrhizobium sp.]